MAKNNLKSLDINDTIGQITLTDGETSIDVPRLSMSKIIQIVKFIGTDGIRIYKQMRELLMDDELSTFDRIIAVIDELKEDQVIRVVAIILGVEDKEALKLDLNEVLDVLIILSENTNLDKTFTQVRTLAKAMFKVEIPDFQALMQERFPVAPEEEPQAEVSA
ncbi:hypothetical protein [Planomicrobium sp. CPCC 101079]|uniref:hypothetical protein n=1 Tax=Planomicrobium sp. CPCC 101079 TaxID=2599618 RepID=UPI0011B84BBA|nr:hypothetical protein [Planomicrobium sp. CPCC 101079]TWT04602.1 hypothetical protein FQV28_08340 [Planomicrobium sp. CPCC 101079]